MDTVRSPARHTLLAVPHRTSSHRTGQQTLLCTAMAHTCMYSLRHHDSWSIGTGFRIESATPSAQ